MLCAQPFTCDYLFRTRFRRDYYWLNGDRKRIWFTWHGLLFVNGALNRDYSLVLSLTILVGTLTILFNAIVDILYAIIDPKIRY